MEEQRIARIKTPIFGANAPDRMMKSDLFNLLLSNYQRYHNTAIEVNHFSHDQMVQVLGGFKKNDSFQIEEAGQSVEGRSIYHLSWGTGPLKVLLWSQMHGDESTATRALLDVLMFLKADDEFNDFRADLAEKVTLHFLPMLNPDGAEHWNRRTSLGIDMNRDAVRLQTPEARILKAVYDSCKPSFAFNLHDQSIYHSAGDSAFPSTISFLAPPYNADLESNDVRDRAKRLIGYLYNLLDGVIPGHIAKYSDDFNPRAFGDNIQKWGTSTVLIESGGYPGDNEKEYIRKLNFVILLEAFSSIASRSYETAALKDYENIPFNEEESLFDLVVRNGVVEREGKYFKIDLGIRRESVRLKDWLHYRKGVISDMGDLSQVHGYEEIDVNGMEIRPGFGYSHSGLKFRDIEALNMEAIIKRGFTSVLVPSHTYKEPFTNYPINVADSLPTDARFEIDGPADVVVLQDKVVQHTIVNGFLYDPAKPNFGIENGLVTVSAR